MQNKKYYAVIMAGGVGSRFWPVSTPEHPKQFHDLTGTGMSLLKQTYSRLSRLIPEDNILISTHARYVRDIMEEIPGIHSGNILPEPAMRNTAPAILYACLKIRDINPGASVVIAPSDHWIRDEKTFSEKLERALQFCESENVLMTMGVIPDHPNTGYGYIQYQEAPGEVKKVIRFTEKPDKVQATAFLEQGNYLWNAGIFIWSVQNILQAYAAYLPDMYKLLSSHPAFENTNEERRFLENHYPQAENLSVDYGIMEKADNVKVMPIDVGWNDLGAWDALYKQLPKDNRGNVVLNADVHLMASEGNLIRTGKGKKVIIKELHNYIVVEKDEYLMIIPLSDAQTVKEYAEYFK